MSPVDAIKDVWEWDCDHRLIPTKSVESTTPCCTTSVHFHQYTIRDIRLLWLNILHCSYSFSHTLVQSLCHNSVIALLLTTMVSEWSLDLVVVERLDDKNVCSCINRSTETWAGKTTWVLYGDAGASDQKKPTCIDTDPLRRKNLRDEHGKWTCQDVHTWNLPSKVPGTISHVELQVCPSSCLPVQSGFHSAVRV